jgi:hypothetical protein
MIHYSDHLRGIVITVKASEFDLEHFIHIWEIKSNEKSGSIMKINNLKRGEKRPTPETCIC